MRKTISTVFAVLLTLCLCLSATVSFAAGDKAVPADISKKDGSYTVPLELRGGDTDASVEEPVFLRISDGKGYATLAWNNASYDELVVDGEHFAPTQTGSTTTFEIPVTAYGKAMKVTAVKDGEETEYGMTFSDSGIHKVRTIKDYLLVVAAMFAVFLVAVLISIRRIKAAPAKEE